MITEAESETAEPQVCIVCRGVTGDTRLVPHALVRPSISRLIAADHPDWVGGNAICRTYLDVYRRAHISALLADETGELGELEAEVIDSVVGNTTISQPPEEEGDLSFGQRMADRVASFGGSWIFILGFLAVLLIWIALNASALLFRAFDPYPFILLNLVLSCVAAMQAPIIMMSQRRQDEKDRAQAETDYQVNLKAELEIRQLHEKIDHHIISQWHRLAEMQQDQIDLLDRVADRIDR